jgi:hypothetical protein
MTWRRTGFGFLICRSSADWFQRIPTERCSSTPPLSQIPPPFPIDSTQHDGSDVSFRPATLWTIDDVTISRQVTGEVSSVRFILHQLSSAEDILVTRLQQLDRSAVRDTTWTG